MLMERARSVLLVVDLQERLMPVIDGGAEVVDHAGWLCRLAGRLRVPVVISEQYPQGLGPTLEAIRKVAVEAETVSKQHFSCVAAGCLAATRLVAAEQVVVCGAEAHVCVLQTAMELRREGKAVFVVAEAVGSRRASDKELALARMRSHGIDIVSREMVAFEWLGRADDPGFREINREFLR